MLEVKICYSKLDQLLNQERRPAGRCQARGLRARVDQLAQAFLLI